MSKNVEEEIAGALHEVGVITLSEKTKDITSITRKWRSVLVKLGFIWPDVEMRPKVQGINQSEIGAPFALTPNGRRLLATKSVQAEQEVILRSLAALSLPSPLEPGPGYDFPPFSPLRHIIRILKTLEEMGHEPHISRLEMASIVIFTNGRDSMSSIVDQIAQLRERRTAAKSKRRFDGDHIRQIAQLTGQKTYSTLYDYQDVSFRYLKATGLFQSRGRGITLAPEKKKTAALLAAEPDLQADPLEYLQRLANGAALPTDTQSGAEDVLTDLLAVATEWGLQFDLSGYNLGSPRGISLARHDLEDLIFEAKEEQYAVDQPNQIGEILAYLELLDENRKSIRYGEETLSIRREERPAYFEWLLWRVLLALGGLAVPSYKVRRFKVDQDFLPVGTAAGGGADVIGIYSDCALVVEVTLTENSRQEAAEGEPVRRHVADVLEQLKPLGKDVFGLFVARRIDTNTAETFRIGVWYLKGDKRVNLDIVPLTITQLRVILTSGLYENKLEPSLLLDAIRELSEMRNHTEGAPEWKREIAKYVGA